MARIGWLSLVILVYAGLLFAHSYYHTYWPIEMPKLANEFEKSVVMLEGAVISDSIVRQEQLRFKLQVQQGPLALYKVAIRLPIATNHERETHSGQLNSRVSSSFQLPIPLPVQGEIWRCQVRLFATSGFQNPAIAHYGRLQAAQGIIAQGTGQEHWTKLCELRQQTQGLARIRQFLRQHLQQLPAGPGRALSLALLLADRTELTQAIRQPLALAGLSHILAVSGMHVGIMAWLGFCLGGFTWRWWIQLDGIKIARANWCACFSLGLAGCYSMLSGFDLPTQRAYAALVIGLLSKMIFGQGSWSVALLFSVLVVLVLTPLAPMALNFWCSFGALVLLWIVFDQQHQTLSLWQALWRSQLLLTFGLLPAVTLMSSQLSLLSPAWNALAIPLLTFVILPGLMVGLLLSVIWFWPFTAVVQGLDWLITGLTWSMEVLPLLVTLSFTLSQTLAIALTTVCWLKPAFRSFTWVGVLALVLSCLPWHRPASGQFWVDVVDVGQGTSSVIRTRHHTLVYDTGARWQSGLAVATLTLLPFLRLQGIRQLDALVISHEDNDHMGGMIETLATLPVQQLYTSTPLAELIPMQEQLCSKPKAWWWDGVLFQLFQTPASWQVANTSNNRSCILRVSNGVSSALLPGDIAHDAEQVLLHDKLKLQADLLIAPHHGSATSSSTGFIKAVNPSLVVFTAAATGRYNHPAPDVVARYLVRGIKMYHSGQSGALQWRSESQ